MKAPVVVYLGNCQAQFFEGLSDYLQLGVEVRRIPPVWLIRDEHRPEVDELLSSADIIFKQRIANDYPIAFVRDDEIKASYPDRTILWPNAYFDGYFPGLKYIYNVAGKVEGPLSDYHFQWIEDGWRSGASSQEVLQWATRGDAWAGPRDVVELSLAQLRNRERGLDVAISDYVCQRFRSKKLFYSMNHPHIDLLYELLRRIYEVAALPFVPKMPPERFPYMLDQIDIPCVGMFRDRYRPTFAITDLIKGRSYSPETGAVDTNVVQFFNWQELIDGFYRIYDLKLARP